MREFVLELQTLARLVALRPEVRVDLADRKRPGWRFNWQNGVISVDPVDVEMRSQDFCRGLLLHEAAHAAITRYVGLIPYAFLSNPGIMRLLNCIEDARIETWLQERYIGSGVWIRHYNDTLYAEAMRIGEDNFIRSPLTGFLMGILFRSWYGELPENWNPVARSALDRIWPAFTRVVQLYPPTQMSELMAMAARYTEHPVARIYRGPFGKSERGLTEAVARMTQFDAWQIIRTEILPVFDELCRQSGETIAPEMLPGQGNFFRIGSESSTGNQEGAANGRGAGGGLERTQPRDPADRVNAESMYDAIAAAHALEIDAVADILLRHLVAEVRPKTRRFLPSGPILDLGVAMQFEADPRRYPQLWQRRTLPQRPDPHFVVLLDVSTSMSGERIAAAQVAAILLREVCLRSGIALSLLSFACAANTLQAWDRPDSGAAAKIALGSLQQQAIGSTDLTAGLQLAATHFSDSPHHERFLWIISDGQPNHFDSAKRLLDEMTPSLSGAFGLGMGAGTTALRQLLPGSATDITPAQLPDAVGRLMAEVVGGGGI